MAGYTTDVTAVNNTIYGNGDDGIQAEGGGCILSHNRIYTNTGDGVYTNGQYTQVESNYFGINNRAVVGASNCDNSTISQNMIKKQTTVAILLASGATSTQIINNDFDIQNSYVSDSGTGTHIADNDGYLARGELRTYAKTITAGAENTTTYFQNPFGQAVYIYETRVAITTAASATNPTYDLKIDTDGSGVPDGTALHDAIPDTVGSYWSWSGAYGTDATGVQVGLVSLASNTSTSDWIGFIIEDAAGADTAGVFYVTLMGK
jgi:hypothetical protein